MSKPNVVRDDDTEDLETIPVRLQRGFSKSGNNLGLVGLARDFMLKEISVDSREEFFAEKTEFTFALPDLMKYPEGFKAFLFKELVESSMLVSLEQEGHLNWWTDLGICDRLLPMVTCGDGNCLLHSASLSMWGFHDRVLALRRALNTVMLRSRHVEAFKRRWRQQQSVFLRSCGLVLDESEWSKEWDLLVEVTSLEPRNATRNSAATKKQSGGRSFEACDVASDAVYESLEEFHVFMLCHIIRRPVIVVANPFLKNSRGENFSPVPFRGIYLPLQREPPECCRSPLLLAYNLGHFCALAAMERSGVATGRATQLSIPLVDSEMNLLPIHFLVDPRTYPGRDADSPGNDFKLSLLEKYLDVKVVSAGDPTSLRGKGEIPLIDLSDGATSNPEMGSELGRFHAQQRRRRRSSVQSTKYYHESPTRRASNGGVTCATLVVKKTPFAEELIENYLQEAQSRYERTSRQKVVQMEEIRRRSREGIQLRHVEQPAPVSSPGKLLNYFRWNNNAGNKIFTLPSKPVAARRETREASRAGEGAVSIAYSSDVTHRISAPIGHSSRSQEEPAQPLGKVAFEKKDSSTAKTIQKLLGQNKLKLDRSTFYKTGQDLEVTTGKSTFYTTIEDLTIASKTEPATSKPTRDVHPVKLPRVVVAKSTLSVSPSLLRCSEESNFSTFPTRSVVQKSKPYDDRPDGESSSSLPKIKTRNTTGDEWKRSAGFNASTSDPNISGFVLPGGSHRSVGANLPCKSAGCTFFGSGEKRGYCSICFAELGFENHSMPEARGRRVGMSGSRDPVTEYLKDQQGIPYCRTKM